MVYCNTFWKRPWEIWLPLDMRAHCAAHVGHRLGAILKLQWANQTTTSILKEQLFNGLVVRENKIEARNNGFYPPKHRTHDRSWTPYRNCANLHPTYQGTHFHIKVPLVFSLSGRWWPLTFAHGYKKPWIRWDSLIAWVQFQPSMVYLHGLPLLLLKWNHEKPYGRPY